MYQYLNNNMQRLRLIPIFRDLIKTALFVPQDSDNLKSQQDWISEASSLRAQLRAAETRSQEAKTRVEEADQEKVMLEVSLRQTTKETDRLRELVRYETQATVLTFF